jgi:hypothetical protein
MYHLLVHEVVPVPKKHARKANRDVNRKLHQMDGPTVGLYIEPDGIMPTATANKNPAMQSVPSHFTD